MDIGKLCDDDVLYERSSTTDCVDDARLDMFAGKQRPYEAIPPTRAALLQHLKCAAYQAGCLVCILSMGSIDTLPNRITKSCRLGLDQ